MYPRTRRLVMLVLLVALVASHEPALAAGTSSPCDSPLPQVLNVGLPWFEGVDVKKVRDQLEETASRIYRDYAGCPNRPLQVNGVLGTDYQLLDWLGREAIDVAVVSTLGLHILRRDGVAVLELPELRGMTEGWSATSAAELRSVEIRTADGTRVDRPHPSEDFEALLEELLALAAGESDDVRQKLSVRLVFPSHLSTPGFLVPVAETRRWLEPQLARLSTEPEKRQELRSSFWHNFFDHACFHFGSPAKTGPTCQEPRPKNELPDQGEPTPEIKVIREIEVIGKPKEFPGRSAESVFRFGEPLRDHLVILASRAHAVFAGPGLSAPSTELPVELNILFGKPNPMDDPAHLVPAFESHRQANPYYGARTFAFTVDESLRLLELHREITGSGGLALILPGGGVKAAYQSRLIDALYHERVANEGALAPESPSPRRLGVSHVIGTSGGALLGFFVARLGSGEAPDLARVLWYRPSPGDDEERPLDSADVFGWTDLPRYASLLSIFLIFSLGLAACSFGPRSWLSPTGESSPTGAEPTFRSALLVPLIAILAATPLLVRLVGRHENRMGIEHVPEIEGLLYAVLIIFAMYADQCMVDRQTEKAGGLVTARSANWALAVGAALFVLPVFASASDGLRQWLITEVKFGGAYLTIAITGLVLSLAAIRRRRNRPLRVPDLISGIAVFGLGSIGAFVLLQWVARARLHWLQLLDRAPLLFLALGATIIGVGVSRIARGPAGAPAWYGWLQRRGGTLLETTLTRYTAIVVGAFLGCLLILDLTRPVARKFASTDASNFLLEPSKLDLPLGGLAVCVGALFVLFGLMARLQARPSGLRLESTDTFVDAVLLVIVGLSLIVYFVLWLFTLLVPSKMTMFELTLTFWLGLLAVTAVLTVSLLLWAYSRKEGIATHRLRLALRFLCSRHPNAHLVTRRFARMLLIGAGGLVWWNLMLAPGLYGNRYADEYLRSTDQRFSGTAPETEEIPPMRLTAPLIATANALKDDGTRFFMVVPGEQPCPEIRQPAGSSSTWYRYHALAETQHEPPAEDGCWDLDLTTAAGQTALRAFVFASGSPFPIFPAHWVDPRHEQGKSEALIDGGYSNLIPVEAAWRLNAERVLIVNSSHPIPVPSGESRWFSRLFGPLVGNVVRLPALLFERAQQLDRRSRGNLFVISLSPLSGQDWPMLADFRRSVVKKMLKTADEDLTRRIGMVESWGPPRFLISAQVELESATDDSTTGQADV